MIFVHEIDGQVRQIEILQLHGADRVGIGHLHVVLIRCDARFAGFRVGHGIGAGAGFCAVSGFERQRFRQNVLAVEVGLKQAADLIYRPRTFFGRGQHGNQHIRIMLNLVQLVMIFIIVVRALVIVQIRLKLVFQRLVPRFCGEHIGVFAGVGTHNVGGRHRAHH